MIKREMGDEEKKEAKGTKISKEVQEIMKIKDESAVKEEKECVFCKIVRKELPAEIIYESQNFIAFPDVRPRVEGHTIIIPKKHYVTLLDMPSSLGSELVDVLKRVFEIKTKQGAEGFNLVMNNFSAAGQVIMHAHIHLLPRKTRDGKYLGL